MEYELIRSNRRTVSLQIKRDGKILVRAPLKMSQKTIDEFVLKHENWIKSKLEIVKNRHVAEDFSEKEIKELKKKLQVIITPILEKYSKIMNVEYTKVSINSARTRFGSCSSKKTLNFSYRLVLYPYEAIEYVCVHELAHLKEMNHSRKFWQIVASILPDYKKRKELLKN